MTLGVIHWQLWRPFDKNQFQNCFEGRTRCWHRCIASQGEYFEGDRSGIQQWGTQHLYRDEFANFIVTPCIWLSSQGVMSGKKASNDTRLCHIKGKYTQASAVNTVNDHSSWLVDVWLSSNTSHTTDHHSATHLKSKFVLILIGKTPHFSDDIAEIVLHKHYCWTEFCSHSFLIMIRRFIAVVTAKEMLQSWFYYNRLMDKYISQYITIYTTIYITIYHNIYHNISQHITISSLYTMFTPTCFDTSVSSSGSFKTCASLSYVSS